MYESRYITTATQFFPPKFVLRRTFTSASSGGSRFPSILRSRSQARRPPPPAKVWVCGALELSNVLGRMRRRRRRRRQFFFFSWSMFCELFTHTNFLRSRFVCLSLWGVLFFPSLSGDEDTICGRLSGGVDGFLRIAIFNASAYC